MRIKTFYENHQKHTTLTISYSKCILIGGGGGQDKSQFSFQGKLADVVLFRFAFLTQQSMH